MPSRSAELVAQRAFGGQPAAARRAGRILAFAAAAMIAGLATPAATRAESPEWLGVLALQLKDAYNCDLDEVVFVREVPLGGTVSTEGRARCIDRREFDFTRASPHARFILHLCQPTVC